MHVRKTYPRDQVRLCWQNCRVHATRPWIYCNHWKRTSFQLEQKSQGVVACNQQFHRGSAQFAPLVLAAT